ncbi:triose phosphate isomerase [Sistotremastrum niveocremeum HHB9708]|uniref:Triosephosphate isomerase n=1 Tax=Sistotremastrum niveocremeum HHB9708 TaxID=1314777 RepID=A0A164R0N6_9AGAM|nr:triose phosphate isomerase [Sistotremastrum niveocremeum HHB9708]
MARKFFVGGNFKMNPTTVESKRALLKALNEATLDPEVEVVIAPPSLYLIPVISELRKDVGVAAQNCHPKSAGAYTGEISAVQLHDAGIPYVILGHSERRALFHETSELVAEKTKSAVEVGLTVILCVGELLEERESGKTTEVVEAQLGEVVKLLDPSKWKQIVVAYEPVWAIGTGKVATPDQAQETHHAIRAYLAKEVSQEVAENTRIIYGGSVNASNCAQLSVQPDIDGFLVGGASLKPEFVQIVNTKLAAAKSSS